MHSQTHSNTRNAAKQTNRPLFVIHGGGNIGLGLVAPIVARAKTRYDIVATSNDPHLTQIINGTNQYTLCHQTEGGEKAYTVIENVRMVSRETNQISKLYISANIVAVCLTPVALNDSAGDIAKGLIDRYNHTREALSILVLMNIPKCEHVFSEKITAQLKMLTDTSTAARILNLTKIIPTVADRIVTRANAKHLCDHLTSQAPEDKSQAETLMAIVQDPVKLAQFAQKHQAPLPLFNAELNYALYVSNTFSEAENFPLLTCNNHLEQLEAIKNKFINGPHAIIAWIGALLGCETIAEAIRIPALMRLIKKIMSEEIQPVLMAEYTDLTVEDLAELRNLFIKRCQLSTDDPVIRVGRDPLRKLNTAGRIRGTIELREKHNHLKTPIYGLLLGVGAGILYSLKGLDPNNPGCKKIMNLYHENKMDLQSVLCYTGDSPSGKFTGFHSAKDEKLINIITDQVKSLERYASLFNTIKRRLSSLKDATMHSTLFVHGQSTLHMDLYAACIPVPKESKHSLPDKGAVQQSRFPGKSLHSFNRFAMTTTKKLSSLGITIDETTGQLRYSNAFKPLSLNYELVFIRHGETYGNCGQTTREAKIDPTLVAKGLKNHDNRIFQGNVDTEINTLTATGIQQALTASQLLKLQLIDKGWKPDVILASPLKRAIDTAQPFVDSNDLQPIFMIHDSIREMSFGSWDNRRVCDIDANNDCHQFYNAQNALVKSHGTNGNGDEQKAESFCDVLLRAHSVLTSLNETLKGNKIIMFSHSMFGAACCILLGKGQRHENGDYLAFDGKRSNGEPYTMHNATPYYLHIKQLTSSPTMIRGRL